MKREYLIFLKIKVYYESLTKERECEFCLVGKVKLII